MSLLDLPERLLQRAVHNVLANPSQSWQSTNGATLQIVAAGLVNSTAGPDFQDMAVLYDGVVFVGDGEFHKRTSDWFAHAHTGSERYKDLLLHIVLNNDVTDDSIARWTLVIPENIVGKALTEWRKKSRLNSIEIDELQHFALLRLLRLTADAQVLITRLGVCEAMKAMTDNWIVRLRVVKRRPVDNTVLDELRHAINESDLGRLVRELPSIPANQLHDLIQKCETARIAKEGAAIRREVLTNIIMPMLCARATQDQRIVLLHWYWGARSAHPYGSINKRFANQPQDFVWQQQGMLEYLRHHGRRISTCGEAIRAYGVSGTLEFLRASG